ncbi:MAG: pirin family protein [Nitrospirota bacterium]|nr:pirin family protein [Nitrospirota bacterium]
MTAPTVRSVETVVDARKGMEGAGLPIRRTLGAVIEMDPFLMLDHFGPVTWGPGQASGVPDHPHRGFETVTYILDGRMEHRDSMGGGAVLNPGDVQWMTAGSGIVHSEMPEKAFLKQGGTLHGFQLWVNLPARLKMTEPRYQDLTAEQTPVAEADGVLARVVAGSALGVRGAVATHTDITYIHYTLQPGASTRLDIPAGHHAGAYVFGGRVKLGAQGVLTGEAQFARFGDGDRVDLTVPEDQSTPAQVLLLAGRPIGEPIARYGPFVMNTYDEIRQAIRDYDAGRMGRIAPAVGAG